MSDKLICSHPLKTGRRHCRQPVNLSSKKCAAGHTCQPKLPDGSISIGPCRFVQHPWGPVCEEHDLLSEQWQVAIALGAEVPCQIPQPTSMVITGLSRQDAPPRAWYTAYLWIEKGELTPYVLVGPSCPDFVLRKAIQNPKYHTYLAQNPSLPLDLSQLILDNGNQPNNANLALSSPHEQILRQLANSPHSHPHTLINIIENPNTPLDLLTQMTETNNQSVLMALARGRRTPEQDLIKLSQNSDIRVARTAVRNHRFPDHLVQEWLATQQQDKYPLIIGHRLCPTSIMEWAANEPFDEHQIGCLVRNPSVTAEILTKLTTTHQVLHSKTIVEALANLPATPTKALGRISRNSPDRYVRSHARIEREYRKRTKRWGSQ